MSPEENMVLADKLAILEAIAAYLYAVDGKAPDAFAKLFTEDGVFEVFRASEGEIPVTRTVSRDGIRSWAAHYQTETSGVQVRHHATGTVFLEQRADAAQTRTMALVTRKELEATAPHVTLTGLFLDTWRRTASGWECAYHGAYAD